MEIRVAAVLFDIDGTLVDSTPVVDRSWRTWAANHGLDAEAILRVAHGRRSQDTVALFLPEAVTDGTAELEALEADDFDGVVALPGAERILQGVPASLWTTVTSGPRELMRARLQVAGLPQPRLMIAAEDVVEGKPDPEGYRMAAQGLGVDPRDCLVVEDAPAGILAGKAAGATVLAVATSHPGHELGDADVVVRDLDACRFDVVDGAVVVRIEETVRG